jgi:hypothetical protein
MSLVRWIATHPSVALAVLFAASVAYVAWLLWFFHRARQRPRTAIGDSA